MIDNGIGFINIVAIHQATSQSGQDDRSFQATFLEPVKKCFERLALCVQHISNITQRDATED